MADEDANTKVLSEDSPSRVPETTEHGQDEVANGTDEVRKDKPADSSWSAPILSFARKATETLSSVNNYSAGTQQHTSDHVKPAGMTPVQHADISGKKC